MALCTSDIPMLSSSHTSGWGIVDVGYLQRRVQKPLLVKACQHREPLGSISGCRRAGKVGVGCAGREKYPVSLSRHIHVYAAVAKNRRNWRTQDLAIKASCHQIHRVNNPWDGD